MADERTIVTQLSDHMSSLQDAAKSLCDQASYLTSEIEAAMRTLAKAKDNDLKSALDDCESVRVAFYSIKNEKLRKLEGIVNAFLKTVASAKK